MIRYIVDIDVTIAVTDIHIDVDETKPFDTDDMAIEAFSKWVEHLHSANGKLVPGNEGMATLTNWNSI